MFLIIVNDLFWNNPADVPRNIVIKHDDRHGPLIPHDMDVIVFVKKNAADTHLGQEPRYNSCSDSEFQS